MLHLKGRGFLLFLLLVFPPYSLAENEAVFDMPTKKLHIPKVLHDGKYFLVEMEMGVYPNFKITKMTPVADETKIASGDKSNKKPEAESTPVNSWDINLLALSSEEAADRFIAKADRLDIFVKKRKITRKGKTLWHLYIPDLSGPLDYVKRYAEKVEQQLKLKDTWVSKPHQ